MIVEVAPSPNSRAKCRRCRKVIGKGESRAQWREPSIYAELVVSYLHAMCAVDVDVASVARWLNKSKVNFDGRDALEALVAARLKAIEEVAKAPEARAAAAVSVERAADPAGRPRVRVLLAGSAFSLGNGPWMDLERFAKDYTWRSPLREYQLVLQFTGEPDPPEDPSQPVVGAVFAPFGDGKAMSNQRMKVTAWKARALPTPLLWIFARGEASVPTDDEVLRWREFIADGGYDGDEARVVIARSADPASLDALVAALDEALSPSAISAPTTIPVTDLTVAAQIEDLVAHERGAAANDALLTALALLRAAKRHDGTIPEFQRAYVGGVTRVTAAGRAAFFSAALGALSLDECTSGALSVLEESPANADNEPLSAAVLAAIARGVSDPKRKLTKSFSRLIAFSKTRAIAGRSRPLLAALAHAKTTARARALAEAIIAARELSTDAEFIAWVDALTPNDPRKTELSAMRASAKRRSAKSKP